jgi:glycosyltransferase involved in cell wall biosynthesis
MNVAYPYLFDFSASHVGGGLKRLYEYAKWFDVNGGAWFMVRGECEQLKSEFSRNEFFVIRRSRLARVFDDFESVRETLRQIGTVPECYYAFGIPLYERVGRVNWFHLSNVLPLAWRGVPLPLATQLRHRLLGRQTRRGLRHADVISAESHASLALFGDRYRNGLFLSVTGSDDEISDARVDPREPQPVAVVVGTYSYKALGESLQVFRALKQSDGELRLMVFGDATLIPAIVRTHPDVMIRGERPRFEVIDALRQARYYISTTMIEGSYNAASEGIFLAAQSYISDIGPHRELLAGQKAERVTLPNVAMPLLRVRRDELSTGSLKTWAEVIAEMNQKIREQLQAAPAPKPYERHDR